MTRQRPNIVLIVLDTHRFDRLSAYGYQRDTSPNIDDFARQATLFKNGISPAQWTIPAHAAIFTGETPTTHQTLQAHSTLDSRFDTLAKLLSANGYQTTGFCNNPLVGILNNGLKRGFNTFYNYGGAVPSVPGSSSRLPSPLNRIWEWYTQLLRRASYPVQNAFAQSDLLFRLSLHPLAVPIWTRLSNFKGNTAQSTRDVADYVDHVQRRESHKPHFVFVNLMETHTPYAPPEPFIEKFAPYFKENRKARDFTRNYNSQAYRWLLPMEERLKGMELKVLNDLYDAEVAYQDHLLAPLLEQLARRDVADNTLTIIVADHGEGLGEHNFMGHSFVAYDELLHVPLIIKFPGEMAAGQTISSTVSTQRLFHTILDAAHLPLFETEYRPAVDVKQFSLARTVQAPHEEAGPVFAEAYPPNTLLAMMETHAPRLVESFHCRLNRWAVYQEPHKLVRIEGTRDELYNLVDDPLEKDNLISRQPLLAARLGKKLDEFLALARERRPDSWQANKALNLEDDEHLKKQLQALGYIE